MNAGVRFDLLFEQEDGSFPLESFYYRDGIADYVAEKEGESLLIPTAQWHLETSGRDRADKPDYKLKADFVFSASASAPMLEYYHNSSFLEHGGSPDKAVRSAFVYAVDKFLRAGKKYKQNEPRITFQDIEDCLVLVINSFSTQTSYENQTKKAITNTFIYSAMNAFLREQLEIYFMEHPAEAEVFTGRILNNKRSRESAESQKNLMRRKFNTVVDMSNRVEKFVNCRTKDVARRELYIVEGDSAMTSVKLARDPEFQAVIPVRGKTLNCLKADYNRISKSDIISDLIRVIGCGVEITGSKRKDDASDFNLANLRWSKIILCTDADEDGFQIRTLLLTMFYRLLPTLIEKERVFIAESPLFEITAKDDIYFAYNEQEKQQIIASLGDRKYTLQRSKGLGENEPEMMWKTTMNPATRRLIKITTADAADTATMFETLLGDDLESRKRFIAENAERYMSQADI